MPIVGSAAPIVGPGRPGKPAFPVRPLDPECMDPGPPRLDVVELVRRVVGDFDPETDPTGWEAVAQLVHRESRYSRDEVRSMTFNDVEMFFRTFAGSTVIQLGGVVHTNTATIVRMDAQPATTDPPGKLTEPRGKTTTERLRELWSTEVGALRILRAGSAEKIGKLIGRAKSSVVEAGPIWDDEIKPQLQSLRSFNALQREEERQRRQQEEEKLDG